MHFAAYHRFGRPWDISEKKIASFLPSVWMISALEEGPALRYILRFVSKATGKTELIRNETLLQHPGILPYCWMSSNIMIITAFVFKPEDGTVIYMT